MKPCIERLPRHLAVAACVLALACLPPARAADPALVRAAAAMKVDEVRTIRYSADGIGYTFGQAFRPGEAWPKINIRAYSRSIDYGTASMRDEIEFIRGEALGGGGYPHAAPQRNVELVSGGYAWNQVVTAPVPGSRFVAGRIHQLWITPHGALKAAVRNSASVRKATREGRTYDVATFAEPGRFTATVFIGQRGLVERVESRVPDPVLGDTPVVTVYSEYRDFAGVPFPTRITQAAGGHPTLALAVREVQPNAPVDIVLPDLVRAATERVTAEKVADGVWFIAGGSHNSVAIEMKDHVVVVETPLNDLRAVPALAKVREVVPGKPIRTVVNSHGHFDHSGGLRAAVAEGATIVTQALNKPYFERAFANANTIRPDALARSGRKARIETVDRKRVITDGVRVVELHHVADSHHSDTFLMVYLPKERLLIEADSFTPGAPNSPPPATPNPNHVNLIENLERLKLDVERILPLHGRVVPVKELYTAVGRPSP